MIDVKCWACKRGDRVAGRYAGLQVAFGACGATVPVPDPDADGAYFAAWGSAMDDVAASLAMAPALVAAPV